MRFVYPYTVEQDENGFWQVRFPDVPAALTEGETEDEAHALAQDVLVAALGAMTKAKQAVPVPSDAGDAGYTVAVPMLQSAKLALYGAIREAGISNVRFANDLGKQESEVRRMLDLDHETKISAIEFALSKLGKQLEMEVVPLAA